MLIAYVWNVSEPANTQIYVLRQDEALRIATEVKYAATDYWINKGLYVVTHPGRELIEKLRPYVVSREKWQQKVLSKAGDIKL
jgi:hypothetical protein